MILLLQCRRLHCLCTLINVLLNSSIVFDSVQKLLKFDDFSVWLGWEFLTFFSTCFISRSSWIWTIYSWIGYIAIYHVWKAICFCMQGSVGVISHEFFYLLRYPVFSWDVSVLRSCSTFDWYHIYVVLPGRSRSRSVSRSRSPPYHSVSRGGHHSRYVINAVYLNHFLLIFTEERWLVWMLMSYFSDLILLLQEDVRSIRLPPLEDLLINQDHPGNLLVEMSIDHILLIMKMGMINFFCCYFLGLIDAHYFFKEKPTLIIQPFTHPLWIVLPLNYFIII